MSLEGSIMTRFSWFPVTAWEVQLNEPVTSIWESMITNLLCMWRILLLSIVTSTPSNFSYQTSAPLNFAHSSSQIILTLTPALCLLPTASARRLLVKANIAISKVWVAEFIIYPRMYSLSFEGKNKAFSTIGFSQKYLEMISETCFEHVFWSDPNFSIVKSISFWASSFLRIDGSVVKASWRFPEAINSWAD